MVGRPGGRNYESKMIREEHLLKAMLILSLQRHFRARVAQVLQSEVAAEVSAASIAYDHGCCWVRDAADAGSDAPGED